MSIISCIKAVVSALMFRSSMSLNLHTVYVGVKLSASILCLAGGPGLCDPCEKDTVDGLSEVSMQERENLTASAQVRNTSSTNISKLLGLLGDTI